jgi:hypothetical protein
VDERAATARAGAAIRLLCAARAALGAAYLVSAAVTPGTRDADRGSRASEVVTVLGGRQLIQAMITWAWPSGTVLVIGAGADAAHAASMAALGMPSGRWRGAAFADALIAVSLATVGVACARHAAPRRRSSVAGSNGTRVAQGS